MPDEVATALEENERRKERRLRGLGLGGAVAEFGGDVLRDYGKKLMSGIRSGLRMVDPANPDYSLPEVPEVEQAAQRQVAASLDTAPAPARPPAAPPKPTEPAAVSTYPGGADYPVRAPGPEPSEPLDETPGPSVRYKTADGQWREHKAERINPGRAAAPHETPTVIGRGWDLGKTGMSLADIQGRERARRAIEGLPLKGQAPSAEDLMASREKEGAARSTIDSELAAAIAENEAKRSLGETIARDPFARERTVAGLDLQKSLGLEAGRSGLRGREEQARTQRYLADMRDLTAMRDEKLAKVAHLPEDDPQRKRYVDEVDRIYEEEAEQIKNAHGFGSRLGQAVN